MSHIVQVRALALAGDDGLDFAGFYEDYFEFFGAKENPNEPARFFVDIKGLVVESWWVEIKISAARMLE